MGVKANVPVIRMVTLPAPAVAGEITITAPGNALWRIVSLAFDLTTDANVANRGVALAADDGSNVFWRVGAGAVQAASLTGQYCAYMGAGSAQTSNDVAAIPLPASGLWLESGWRLLTDTLLIQAGDQYGAVNMLVEEYPTGPRTMWVPTNERAEYDRT